MNNQSPDFIAKLKEKKKSQCSCPVTIATPPEEETEEKNHWAEVQNIHIQNAQLTEKPIKKKETSAQLYKFLSLDARFCKNVKSIASNINY